MLYFQEVYFKTLNFMHMIEISSFFTSYFEKILVNIKSDIVIVDKFWLLIKYLVHPHSAQITIISLTPYIGILVWG